MSTTATMHKSTYNQVVPTFSLMNRNPKTSLDAKRPDNSFRQLEIYATFELLRLIALWFWLATLLRWNQGKHHTQETRRLFLYIGIFLHKTYIPTSGQACEFPSPSALRPFLLWPTCMCSGMQSWNLFKMTIFKVWSFFNNRTKIKTKWFWNTGWQAPQDHENNWGTLFFHLFEA